MSEADSRGRPDQWRSSAPITVVHITSLVAFIEQLECDLDGVRHRQVSAAVSQEHTGGEIQATYKVVRAAYIHDDGDTPKLVELRLPCGHFGRSASEAEQEVATMTLQASGELQAAADRLGLDFRVGRLSTEPPRMLPRPQDLLRTLCPQITTSAGVTYTPWGDGTAVGFECREESGRRTYLYVRPENQPDAEEGLVCLYHGCYGDPDRDTQLFCCSPLRRPPTSGSIRPPRGVRPVPPGRRAISA